MRSSSGMHDQIACKCDSHSACSCNCRPGCGCHCEEVCLVKDSDHCGAHLMTFPGITAMAESILYPIKDDNGRHTRECVFDDCDNCGVDFLPLCPIEEDGLEKYIVKWKHFAMGKIITKKGEVRKKLQLVYKETTFDQFLSYLKPKLQEFARHSFVAK